MTRSGIGGQTIRDHEYDIERSGRGGRIVAQPRRTFIVQLSTQIGASQIMIAIGRGAFYIERIETGRTQ